MFLLVRAFIRKCDTGTLKSVIGWPESSKLNDLEVRECWECTTKNQRVKKNLSDNCAFPVEQKMFDPPQNVFF
jgi:hypothetical protein